MLWQVERYDHFEAYITPHVENTGLHTGRNNRVIKIFKPAHVRLVIYIGQVGTFNKYLEYVFAFSINHMRAYTRA